MNSWESYFGNILLFGNVIAIRKMGKEEESVERESKKPKVSLKTTNEKEANSNDERKRKKHNEYFYMKISHNYN